MSQKNIPDIFDSNVNKNYQIFKILFGVNILDTTNNLPSNHYLILYLTQCLLPQYL